MFLHKERWLELGEPLAFEDHHDRKPEPYTEGARADKSKDSTSGIANARKDMTLGTLRSFKTM